MKKRRKKKSLIAPDLTPLIDVVFLLLIFFMVVTNFNKYSNFNLKLPESGIKSEEVKNNYELIIDGNGKYFLKENKKEIPITLENLGERLQGVKKISISADKNLKYEVIVKAIGKIKSLGINDVGLNFYE
ncbi:MAG: biopolymer transporter ExbD [Cetobacterium sp.]|uniref:Biopolymer transport protein ExbD n=1 Tax=Cetobacterium ceti TaxID=180163 RepID=A0A1T4LA78_9FUSO|nr:biopolymer transporter ExbD [Cetobacterium ceti]MCJ8342018.1 biopolymer transporter ExbD [Cetobacterium sp.]SJZ51682.1 biopolymer transport protein ExbD [Cetobacterium ceti]